MLKLLSVFAVAGAGFVAMAAAVSAQNPPTPTPPVELKVGDQAPPFSLQGSDGKAHRLSDYKGKTVVVAWFPMAFTGG